eukprot:scaffold3424_cov256-Pinguiococcus_pyrenoidosus.AAC.4
MIEVGYSLKEKRFRQGPSRSALRSLPTCCRLCRTIARATPACSSSGFIRAISLGSLAKVSAKSSGTNARYLEQGWERRAEAAR